MKVLFITQVYAPDTVSVSQHLTDLAERLSLKGCEVDVISSRYQYEDPSVFYATNEMIFDVSITRIRHAHFKKGNPVLRAINMLTFNVALTLKLFCYRGKADVIIGTTVPPFSALVGILAARLKKAQFHYWVMDLQPELSISSGLLKRKSILAWIFTHFGNFIIRNSDKIYSIDQFMSDYLVERGASRGKIITNPVWPVVLGRYEGDRLSNPFRVANNFGEKIVVMYSGNHAYVHPLCTLLEAARLLRDQEEFVFVFIGGGVRKQDVTDFANSHQLKNIVQLPFQPREYIHLSLGASDIQVVTMGENLVGFTHPNKIYGALFLAKPILYIGPRPSHVSKILDDLKGNIQVDHGEAQKIVMELQQFSKMSGSEITLIGERNRKYCDTNFDPAVLMDVLVNTIIDDIDSDAN